MTSHELLNIITYLNKQAGLIRSGIRPQKRKQAIDTATMVSMADSLDSIADQLGDLLPKAAIVVSVPDEETDTTT